MSKTLILHHANCPDGFGAAWLMNRHLAGMPDVTTVPMNYGDPIPDLTGVGSVVSVDFCPSADQLKHLMASVEQFVVLDHHASAVDYCRDAGLRTWDSVADYTADHDYSPQLAILDMNRSGIGVVLEWTTPPLYPQFLLNLEDRDLWRRSLHGTDEVFAAVTSRPYTTEAWDAMANMLWAQLYDEGGAIERYRQNVVAQIVETAYTGHLPNGLEVLMVGCPYALGSDVAGVLAAISPTKVAAYYIDYGTFVKWGLRSTEDGPNVKEIAAECATGGGGHPHAAGFEIRHEDERGGY